MRMRTLELENGVSPYMQSGSPHHQCPTVFADYFSEKLKIVTNNDEALFNHRQPSCVNVAGSYPR
jgi:hypothetical protein